MLKARWLQQEESYQEQLRTLQATLDAVQAQVSLYCTGQEDSESCTAAPQTMTNTRLQAR